MRGSGWWIGQSTLSSSYHRGLDHMVFGIISSSVVCSLLENGYLYPDLSHKWVFREEKQHCCLLIPLIYLGSFCVVLVNLEIG